MNFKGRTVALLLLVTSMVTCAATVCILNYKEIMWSLSGSSIFTSTYTDDNFEGKLDKLKRAYALIHSSYIRPYDEQKLVDGAIQGMFEALGDPHSSYMDKKTAQLLKESLQSSFTGIGATTMMKDGYVTIVAPLKGSPAEKAGVKSGDRIILVNNKKLKGLVLEEAVSLMRGPKGTKANLEIMRPGVTEVVKIAVVRDEIPLESVSAKLESGKIGVVKISRFAEETAKDFSKELKKLENQGMRGLIIDVRGNPGGILQTAQEMLNQLVPSKKTIFMVEFKDGSKPKTLSTGKDGKKYPIYVLIDKGSASASEILAASLRESTGSKLFGERSYGKGTVQQTHNLPDGSNVKLTMAKWLTPKGIWIDQHGGTKGIEPDVAVKQADFFNLIPPQVTKTIKKDANVPAVKLAQLLLDALGYTPGRFDGYFDSKTEMAFKAFQSAQKIKVTGELDVITSEKMQAAVMQMRNDPKNDVQLQVALQAIKKGLK